MFFWRMYDMMIICSKFNGYTYTLLSYYGGPMYDSVQIGIVYIR